MRMKIVGEVISSSMDSKEVTIDFKDLDEVYLIVENVGLPGVIGPHLEFSIKELIQSTNEMALKLAFQS